MISPRGGHYLDKFLQSGDNSLSVTVVPGSVRGGGRDVG